MTLIRDEPTERLVSRQKGRKVSASRFHYYRDCGWLTGGTEPPDDSDFEILVVDDAAIDLLALTVCTACKGRAENVSAYDVIADAIGGQVVTDEERIGHDIDAETAAAITDDVMEALFKYGYHIVKKRKST